MLHLLAVLRHLPAVLLHGKEMAILQPDCSMRRQMHSVQVL